MKERKVYYLFSYPNFMIYLYESEFERMIQNAKETAPAKKKMYHSLGIFGGAMIAILFW